MRGERVGFWGIRNDKRTMPALFRIQYDTAGLGQWVHRLSQRAARNKVVVVIANKLARIAWAVLSSGRGYRHQPLQPAAG